LQDSWGAYDPDITASPTPAFSRPFDSLFRGIFCDSSTFLAYRLGNDNLMAWPVASTNHWKNLRKLPCIEHAWIGGGGTIRKTQPMTIFNEGNGGNFGGYIGYDWNYQAAGTGYMGSGCFSNGTTNRDQHGEWKDGGYLNHRGLLYWEVLDGDSCWTTGNNQSGCARQMWFHGTPLNLVSKNPGNTIQDIVFGLREPVDTDYTKFGLKGSCPGRL